MILVCGSTGFLGREICRRLTARGHAVRGLVRATSDPAAVAQLRGWGVETVEGDLKDRASLDRACRGVEAVVSTATTTRTRQEGDSIGSADQDGQLALVDAAREAGAERFVFVSFSGQVGLDDPLTRAKRAVEERVRQSGMTYTILRPSCFMEVWLSPALGFDYPSARATLYGGGDAPLSWISLGDVAEFAVAALENPAARNATLELGGPEALSPREVVRVFEEAGGRDFEVQTVPEEALRARYDAATDPMERAFTALMLSVARGDPIPMEETLRTYPVRLRSVREYAREVLAAPVPLPH
ncbi:MAG TPA: SDR family oxidoreductase [Longimicrobiaceae bacterium]|nr:SDR family oxidoreductase [Longimicrobiaceae bacterium]